MNAVLRLLKGEAVAILSRELGVSVTRLERWQSEFVTAGAAALTKRKSSGPGGWVAEHAAAILQWVAFLIVLAIVIVFAQRILQRGGD